MEGPSSIRLHSPEKANLSSLPLWPTWPMMRKSFSGHLLGSTAQGSSLCLHSHFTFVLTTPFVLTVSFSAEFTFTTSTLSWYSLLSVVSPLPVSPSKSGGSFVKCTWISSRNLLGFSCSLISSSILLLITLSTFSFDLPLYFSLGILMYSPNFSMSYTN